jgi:hypothetical protein
LQGGVEGSCKKLLFSFAHATLDAVSQFRFRPFSNWLICTAIYVVTNMFFYVCTEIVQTPEQILYRNYFTRFSQIQKIRRRNDLLN